MIKSKPLHGFWTPGPEQLACGLACTAAGHLHNDDHYLPPRTVDEIVLGLVVDGAGWVRLGQRRWTCTGPGLWVCPAQVEHDYGCDTDTGWSLWWCHIRGSHAERVLAHCGFNADNPWLPLAQAEATEGRFQALVTAVLAPPADASCAVMAHLGLLLHHLPDDIRHSDAPIAKGLGLLDYRTTDLSGPAAAAGCSVPQFVKRFKRATGHTPWQYVLSRRIDRAKELLAGTAEAVATIAHQVGFDDADYFSRVFRKRVGYAPSVFRSRFSESRLT